jgi:hypothetical protein
MPIASWDLNVDEGFALRHLVSIKNPMSKTDHVRMGALNDVRSD